MLSNTYSYLSHTALDAVEQNAVTILREQGVLLKGDAQSLDTLAAIGADIQGERVRLDGRLLREIITATAPSQFIHHARNPQRSTLIGGGTPICTPIYGAPQFKPLNRPRRAATIQDYDYLVALAQSLPALQNTGHMICVPNDLDENPVLRSLKMAAAHLHHADKPFMGSILSPQALESVAILTNSAFHSPQTDGVRLIHLINSIPPLTYPANALACLRRAVQLQQGVIITSFMLMGAMAPVSIMGALAQGLAEVLVGAALAQLYAPGAAMILGIYAAPFSMRKMLPEFGGPVSHQIQLSAASLLHRLGTPVLGYAGLTSSNLNDSQAGYQASLSTQTVLCSKADFLLHSAGWLENGRQVCEHKMIMDAQNLLPYIKLDQEDMAAMPMDDKVCTRFNKTLTGLLKNT
jgi:trimethylamine---corrinoid protein Co-methyltransferase